METKLGIAFWLLSKMANRPMRQNYFTTILKKQISLNLNSKKLNRVPKCVSNLTNLSVLLLCNNLITGLPAGLRSLEHLSELNLGNNALNEFPAVLRYLRSLKKLYLFKNQITELHPGVIDCLQNLGVLNLNDNKIEKLPAEIGSLTNLKYLSLMRNNLTELPKEISHLTLLSELNLTHNKLTRLPQQLYKCRELTKLYVSKNKLTSLPEGIKVLTKLRVLDVAGNKLTIFPVQFHLLKLKELHCEENKFVRYKFRPLLQAIEVLTLKEQVSRFVLRELGKRFSLVHKMLPHYPSLTDLLAFSSCCELCKGPFLATWLECVHFVKGTKDIKWGYLDTIPVRALLCSYQCFNTEGHSYFAIASGCVQKCY